MLSATVVAVSLAVAAPASATLIITAQGQQGGSGDLSNVIFNNCGTSPGPSTTVQGCLNTDTSTRVNFSSTQLLTIGGGGQAVIDGGNPGGGFDNITIGLANSTTGFDELLFNVNASANGFVTITGIDQFNQAFVLNAAVTTNTFGVGGAGENFFRITTADGQVARSITITSSVALTGIDDLRQVRIGPTAVPEPMSLALFGAGLLGLGMVRRKQSV